MLYLWEELYTCKKLTSKQKQNYYKQKAVGI